MTKGTTSSPRKAASNRRNAAKSTGPRTARGKARSRLNAMKHGILASQTVIATMEGYAERKLFEATVEGLERDFQPVGTYEQLLVQEIAACFWRKRRLLQFENKAAFDSLDRPASEVTNDPETHAVWRPAMYLHDGNLVLAQEVHAAAGLDRITLPSERDTMRVIRYETVINRTRERSVAALREMRKARDAMPASREEAPPPALDRASRRRNAKRARAMLVSPIQTIGLWSKFDEIYRESGVARRALDAEMSAESKQNDETKPKKVRTDEEIAEMRRTIYRELLGQEPPEEPAEEPSAAEAEPNKPPEC
jgi:hypothetical protein